MPPLVLRLPIAASRLPILCPALQASAELQELCRLQLQLLTAALKLSLQAVLSSSVLGSVGDSLDEELLRQQLLLETSCLRASAYCRAPASLQTGALQLQLVATSDDGGSSGGSSGSGSVSSAQAAQRFLFLGQEGTGGGSLHEQEQWILEQAVIVLPDRWALRGGEGRGLVGVEEQEQEGCCPQSLQVARQPAVTAYVTACCNCCSLLLLR